jgi:glycosyltransferase involved in cell wall biosynthesis
MSGLFVSEILDVVHLAGKFPGEEGSWPLAPLLDALRLRGINVRVVCLSRGVSARDDPRSLECPELASRWRRMLCIRRLGNALELRNARLIHAVHDCMIDIGLALADQWKTPYLQSLDDLEQLPGVLRLNRRWCRGLIVPTPGHAARLVEERRVPDQLVRVITPGLTPRPDFRCSGRGTIPVIGTAGAAADRTALDCFLQAARRVLDQGRDVEFLIAIQDTDPLEVRRAALEKSLADRVTLIDPSFLDARFWTVLNVFCHPATLFTTARSLFRAMAEGIPSIATLTEGIEPLIVDGRSGHLVPPDDPDALASAIIRLIDDPSEALNVGRRGQEVIRSRFSLDVEADLLASLYRSCALTGPRA